MKFSLHTTLRNQNFITKHHGATILGSFIAFSTLIQSTNAMALISGELDVGHRSATMSTSGSEDEKFTSSTLEAAVHLDPIPLVPVSFGLRLINDTYKVTMADDNLKSLTSAAIVPEVAAWFPFGSLRPFVRLGYTAISTYKASLDSEVGAVNIIYKASGTRVTAGIEYSLIPLVALTAAYENSTEKLDLSEAKAAGIDLKSQLKDSKVASNAILVGVKVGI